MLLRLHRPAFGLGADHIGPPEDAFESDRIAWIPLTDIRGLIDKHHIVAGTTLAALLYLLTDPATSPQ